TTYAAKKISELAPSWLRRPYPPPPASTRPPKPSPGGGRLSFKRAAGSRSAAFAFWTSQCWQAQEHDSRNETLWNVRLHQSALAPENLITSAHFSVSVAMNLAKSEDEPGNTAAPRSANRAFSFGSARPALISLLSLSTISAGVSLGAPRPSQRLVS